MDLFHPLKFPGLAVNALFERDMIERKRNRNQGSMPDLLYKPREIAGVIEKEETGDEE
jgi:hypothetical protein